MNPRTCVATGVQLKPRVLLADDCAALNDAIARLLAASCDVVGGVSDGVQLLDAVKQLGPDVVVVDLHMPGMHGLELCGRLRAAAPQVEIILFTADDDAEVKSAALAVGASAFVAKYRAAVDLGPAIETAFANQVFR